MPSSSIRGIDGRREHRGNKGLQDQTLNAASTSTARSILSEIEA